MTFSPSNKCIGGDLLEKKPLYSEGDQNMPPPNMPSCYMDYVALHTLEEKQVQEGVSDLPLST